MVKTNAMRMLDKAKIQYTTREYEVDEQDLSGSHAADMMGADHGSVYKTLVLKGEKMGYLVCCIPVDGELDLKKVAKAAGDKKVEMVPMKDLQGITGYIRGGCSPIGMKKQFLTFIEESARSYEEIVVSGGLRGQQIVISPQTLVNYIKGEFAPITQY
ncbi:MAG TPA: Cys-tRNA(Pro) deacylase [Lachnoclostridium sp.]|jgi:Cys-tRNA(Pro)/Cys-tRNA(Cys) deacylase|uniref:Cys-tRNA(Pro) deacylase n=1 Tax=Lacrimispora sp. TaxID=2719234 RepID=UPI000ECB1A03|nr:Cys-tRNA(Pro) deacylase [Lacrimispora sp.]HCD46188.1 Cys-tRNA(Pro) deacylase [Lachnoclostridium sp.]